MKNFILTVAYDGTEFLGWQENGSGPSVEGELRKALEIVLQEKVVLQAASRTDAGVHAEGQVVNLFSERKPQLFALNQLLPKAIRILKVAEVDDEFHPTLNALGKIYSYEISSGRVQLPNQRHYSWHCFYDISVEKMREGSIHLVGKKDFSALANKMNGEDVLAPICNLCRIEIFEGNDSITIEMEGDRFLYRMARNIVGLLVHVGRGIILPSEVSGLIKACDRRASGMTAPAHGLTLKRVIYSQSVQ